MTIGNQRNKSNFLTNLPFSCKQFYYRSTKLLMRPLTTTLLFVNITQRVCIIYCLTVDTIYNITFKNIFWGYGNP